MNEKKNYSVIMTCFSKRARSHLNPLHVATHVSFYLQHECAHSTRACAFELHRSLHAHILMIDAIANNTQPQRSLYYIES